MTAPLPQMIAQQRERVRSMLLNPSEWTREQRCEAAMRLDECDLQYEARIAADAAPADRKSVPREPTQQMLVCGWRGTPNAVDHERAADIWRAMYDAAPPPAESVAPDQPAAPSATTSMVQHDPSVPWTDGLGNTGPAPPSSEDADTRLIARLREIDVALVHDEDTVFGQAADRIEALQVEDDKWRKVFTQDQIWLTQALERAEGAEARVRELEALMQRCADMFGKSETYLTRRVSGWAHLRDDLDAAIRAAAPTRGEGG